LLYAQSWRVQGVIVDDKDLSAPSVEARMHQLIFGFMAVPAIGVAAKLRIPDLVADSAMTAEELAALTNADAPSLGRLLRFLASLGILVEDGAGKFRNTPLSESLRTGAPQSFGGLAILLSSEYMCGPGAISTTRFSAASPDSIAFMAHQFLSISLLIRKSSRFAMPR
jgi:hypothetical protein